MYSGSSSDLFRRFALPQMIGLLFNSIYIIVDGLFIGNRLGRDAMAAAAVGVPLVEILISLSMMIASGAGIIISESLGRGDDRSANRAFNTAVLTAGIFGIAIMIFGNLFIDPIAKVLGSTESIHEMAVTYIRYIITFSPFMLYSYLLGGMVRNDGRPKLAMSALTVGSLSNILLDYVFMYPLNMGIGGAALATAIGPIISDGLLLPHFIRHKGKLSFSRASIRVSETARILKLGVPSFVMEFTIGIVTFVYNTAIGAYGFGEIGLAAYLVIGYLMLIILTLFLGFAEGLQPVFSYLTGTGEADRCEALRRYAAKIFILTGLISYVLILLFSRGFYQLFTPGDPELTDFMVSRSRPYFAGFFLAGYNILMISYWQSTDRPRQALILSLLRSVIFPPILTALLPRVFGSEALWLCHSLSECLSAGAAGLMADELKKETAKKFLTT
ncbi:MAG: MATE family efflux transporter [Lachnospiraceae bacterium]|jgi:putative MATE family efflux protein